jgi:hypothetical protein
LFWFSPSDPGVPELSASEVTAATTGGTRQPHFTGWGDINANPMFWGPEPMMASDELLSSDWQSA